MYSRQHQDREYYWSEYVIIWWCTNLSLSARLIRFQKHGMDSTWSQSKLNNQHNILLLKYRRSKLCCISYKTIVCFPFNLTRFVTYNFTVNNLTLSLNIVRIHITWLHITYNVLKKSYIYYFCTGQEWNFPSISDGESLFKLKRIFFLTNK